MPSRKSRYVETKIRRLTREINKIDQFFYASNETKDRFLYASMLEHKRDDVVRSVVLQLHTAIEDLLVDLIECRFLNVKPEARNAKMRTKAAQALQKMLRGAGSLGFDRKLDFAMALGVINTRTRGQLSKLNELRNKCSHNWLLKVPVRRKKKPPEKKPPLLLYQGRNLHNVVVLEEFAGEYGDLYFQLYGKVYAT